MRQKPGLLCVWLVFAGIMNCSYSQELADQVAADSANYQWVKVTMDAPFAPRDGAGALVFQGQMWLIGGWNPKPQYQSCLAETTAVRGASPDSSSHHLA